MFWYKDPDYTVKYTDGSTLSEDTTLYGRLEKNPVVNYSVKNAPSGKLPPNAEEIPYGSKYIAQSKPTYSGYTFSGWYTDPDCTKPYVDGTVITANTTLYGKWTANNAVATGDDFNGVLWGTLALFSIIALMSGIIIMDRKRRMSR